MGLRRELLVLLIANAVAASPALAQLLGDRVEANCSFVASGSVDNGGADNGTVGVICGLPPEQVADLVKLAASLCLLKTLSTRQWTGRSDSLGGMTSFLVLLLHP